MKPITRALACILPLGLASALGLHPRPLSSWEPPAAEFTHSALAPERALAYVEFRDPSGLLARGADHPLARALLATAGARALLEPLGGDADGALARLDAWAGYGVLPALAEVSANGAAFSFHLRHMRPAWVLSLHGADEARVERVLDRALARAAELAGHPGAFETPTRREGDVEIWRIGEALALARRGAWIVAAESEQGLREALARERGLASAPAFSAAYAAREPQATLWGWAALGLLRGLQEVSDGDKGLVELAAAAAEPGAQLLLGPGLSLVGRADSWSLGLSLHGEDLELVLDARGIEAGPATALLPGLGAVAPALPGASDRNQVAALLYRDLAGIFRERGALFAPRAQPGFAEAESNLALFFGGRDVAEAVLPELAPWIAAVVRPVTFDERARPEAPLPALALLVPVEGRRETGEDLVAGFQTMIGLINVDRAQKGRDALRMDLESEGGVTVTAARFRAPAPGDGVDLRYNLEPACAVAGGHFVIGTHRALVRELVRELGEPPAHPGGVPAGEWLRLQGAALAQLVRAHGELLVMRQVLDKGKSQDEARAELELLRDALEHLVELDLGVSRSAADGVRLRLGLDLRPGDGQR